MKARKRTLAAIAALAIALGLGACGGDDAGEKPDIDEVVDRHAAELVAIEGVSAVAAGYQKLRDGSDGPPFVHVWVTELTDALRARLPSRLEGYPVVIEETGGFVPVEP